MFFNTDLCNNERIFAVLNNGNSTQLGEIMGTHGKSLLVESNGEMGMLVVISGPSGSGKTSLRRGLCKIDPQRFVFSLSATTRKPRGTEATGHDYDFITLEEFHARKSLGYFLEWAEVYGNYYGTPLAETRKQVADGKIVLLDIDTVGHKTIRDQTNPIIRGRTISIFVTPPEPVMKILEDRIRRRATINGGSINEEDLRRRLAEAEAELARQGEFDHVLISDKMEKATTDAFQLINQGLVRIQQDEDFKDMYSHPSGTLHQPFAII